MLNERYTFEVETQNVVLINITAKKNIQSGDPLPKSLSILLKEKNKLIDPC